MINSEKLPLILGIPARHQCRAAKHEDVTINVSTEISTQKMSTMNPKVDEYISKIPKWKEETIS